MAARKEVAFLKDQGARSGTEEMDYDKLVSEVCEESKQRMSRLKIVLVGRNRAGILMRSLMTELNCAVDVVGKQRDYDTVSRLLKNCKERIKLYACPARSSNSWFGSCSYEHPL